MARGNLGGVPAKRGNKKGGYKDSKAQGSAPSSGRGFRNYQGMTPGESVDKMAHDGVPGGESGAGTWIDPEGPNSPAAYGDRPKTHGNRFSLPDRTVHKD